MNGWVIVAVDPGARDTGIVLMNRDGGLAAELLGHITLHRDSKGPIPEREYLITVVAEAHAYVRAALDHARDSHRHPLLAVESVNGPTPHLGLASPAPLIGLGMVYGALAGHGWPIDLVEVPPGPHGQGPLPSYPQELVGVREKQGTGERRHLRSAWDIGLAAPTWLALRRRGGSP